MYFNSTLLILHMVLIPHVSTRITHQSASLIVFHSSLPFSPAICCHMPFICSVLFRISIRKNYVANIHFCLKMSFFCPSSWKTFCCLHNSKSMGALLWPTGNSVFLSSDSIALQSQFSAKLSLFEGNPCFFSGYFHHLLSLTFSGCFQHLIVFGVLQFYQ